MPGEFALSLRADATELIEEFGFPVQYMEPTQGEFNPTEGGSVGFSTRTITAAVTEWTTVKTSQGSRQAAVCYVSGEAVPIPHPEGRMVIEGLTYKFSEIKNNGAASKIDLTFMGVTK